VLSRSAEYGVLIWRNLGGFLKGEMQCHGSASPHCACGIVIAEQISGAHLIQPLLVYSIRKKLDFENSDVDGMPTRPVESLAKIATATDTTMMKNCSSALLDCSRTVPTRPNVCGRSLRVFQNVSLKKLLSGVERRSQFCQVATVFGFGKGRQTSR
jgi:hypothetical protein